MDENHHFCLIIRLKVVQIMMKEISVYKMDNRQLIKTRNGQVIDVIIDCPTTISIQSNLFYLGIPSLKERYLNMTCGLL